MRKLSKISVVLVVLAASGWAFPSLALEIRAPCLACVSDSDYINFGAGLLYERFGVDAPYPHNEAEVVVHNGGGTYVRIRVDPVMTEYCLGPFCWSWPAKGLWKITHSKNGSQAVTRQLFLKTIISNYRAIAMQNRILEDLEKIDASLMSAEAYFSSPHYYQMINNIHNSSFLLGIPTTAPGDCWGTATGVICSPY